MTVGTDTDGMVAVRARTDDLILGTETVTEGTVSATRGTPQRAGDPQQRESRLRNARGPAHDPPSRRPT